MPVPDYETLMLPVLRLFGEGVPNVAACLPRLRTEFALTEAEAAEMLPSGRVTILQNRAHWARTYLSKAGLLHSPGRNRHAITEAGRAVLANPPARIDNAFLARFAGFEDWRNAPQVVRNREAGEPADAGPAVTPEETVAAAIAALDAALREDLVARLATLSPQRFERLILDLLSAMGYGGGDLSNARMTPTTGDGGIDGIIHEDALGLDAVYVQAKRYAPGNSVGRPAIQQFIGTLTGEGAAKGVFVTTSAFSREAREFLGKVQQRVVLIDGQHLARLLIRHRVGVRERERHAICTIAEDWFAED
ncbi:MAG: restriction endonuclease [Gemmobacter sp.]